LLDIRKSFHIHRYRRSFSRKAGTDVLASCVRDRYRMAETIDSATPAE